MAVAELAGVPLVAVAIARISYEVAPAPAPAPDRRLRRLLASDGYSTLLVRNLYIRQAIHDMSQTPYPRSLAVTFRPNSTQFWGQ